MKFLKDIYLYSFEGINNNVYQYRFISSVKGNDIIKIASLRPTIDNWFNLGFGNLEYDKNGKPFVSDVSENNNNDFDKVLATVFSCLLHFFNLKPSAKITFFGNTEHKHIVYKRKIAANIKELQEYFMVQGGFADFDVQIIETEQKTQKKSGIVKRKIKQKDHNTLTIRGVTGLEIFNPQKSKEYHFVLIALNEVLKP